MRIFLLTVFVITWFESNAAELSIKVDTFGVTTSAMKGRIHGTIVIQQFRWNEWCNVDTLGVNQQWNDTIITCTIHLHSGENQIRLMAIPSNPYMSVDYSKVAKATTLFKCHELGKCNSITFNVKSYWEIRDTSNVVLRSGYSSIVNSTGLPKGGYFLYYDNKMSEFFKN